MKALLAALIGAGVIGLGALTAVSVTAADLALPDAPGRVQVEESCMQCHGANLIVARRRSADEWSQVVSQMIGYGATLTDEQYANIVDYLSKNLAPTSSAAQPAPAPTSPAP